MYMFNRGSILKVTGQWRFLRQSFTYRRDAALQGREAEHSKLATEVGHLRRRLSVLLVDEGGLGS